jgi:hypothetical protein
VGTNNAIFNSIDSFFVSLVFGKYYLYLPKPQIPEFKLGASNASTSAASSKSRL